MNWTEAPPHELNLDPNLLEAASDCAAARLSTRAGAGQLVVLRRGRVALDRAYGAALPRSLFLLYSASKPYTAMLVHLLAEMSLLSLDEPVAAHWPRFARHGKGSITPRHVLQHRAGVPHSRRRTPQMLASMRSWSAAVRAMEELRPEALAATRPAYHPLTFGFILGELVRRVTGQPVATFLRRAFLGPLRLEDTYLGLPRSLEARAVPMVAAGHGREWLSAVAANRGPLRRGVVPAASISATARDVARFYEMLRCGGELDGTRVLAPRSVREARRVSSDGEMDATLGRRVRWAQGFHLGGVRGDHDLARVMGDLSDKEAFGHDGSFCCTAWTDPRRELTFVYLTNLLLAAGPGIQNHGLVADCVLRACR
ncbi:MAG: beta-lactamase family protein [Candidatus Dormibacteraeota bacterium]|nr:beta-lactamase family protein [Candidatus Dormibacteraeota bacterium]